MQQNQNEALFFDVGATMKKRSTTRCLKKGVYFSFSFGWSSNQVDFVR